MPGTQNLSIAGVAAKGYNQRNFQYLATIMISVRKILPIDILTPDDFKEKIVADMRELESN